MIELPADRLVTTISVGNDPHSLCVTRDGLRLFVTNQSDDTVSVIDPALDVVATIKVGRGPTGVAVHPKGHRVYVAENDAGALSVIDTWANAVVDVIPVGRCPARVALTPNGTLALVTNAADRSVTVIHSSTGTVVENVLMSTHPIGVATSHDGRLALVAGLDASGVAGEISVLDLKANGLRTIPAGSPFDIVMSPSGDRCYVTDFAANAVSVIAPRVSTIGTGTSWHHSPTVRTVRIGRTDSTVTVDADSGRVFATNGEDGTVSMVDAWMQPATVPVGNCPTAVAVNLDKTRAYVTNYGEGSVTVIDTEAGSAVYQRAIDTITVGPMWSTGLLLDRRGTRAYAVTEGVPGIRVIDTVAGSPQCHTVIATVAMPAPLCDARAPTGIACTPSMARPRDIRPRHHDPDRQRHSAVGLSVSTCEQARWKAPVRQHVR